MADAPLTLEAAAQQHAALYVDDDRQDIGTDVFNAFAAGAKWATSKAPPSPPVAAPAGRYVIFTRPGKVPERKGPYPTTALMESALREIQQAYPDAISMVLVDLPTDCWPTSGVEWIDMYGDKRKGRLIAAPQPPRPGTAPLSDEQCEQAARDFTHGKHLIGSSPELWFLRGMRAAERAHGIGHPTTPTPKD